MKLVLIFFGNIPQCCSLKNSKIFMPNEIKTLMLFEIVFPPIPLEMYPDAMSLFH